MINANSNKKGIIKKLGRFVISLIICGMVIILVIFGIKHINSSNRKINFKFQHAIDKNQDVAKTSKIKLTEANQETSVAQQMQANAPQTLQAVKLQNQLQQIKKTIVDSSLSQNKIDDLESQLTVLVSNIKTLQESANATKEITLKTAAEERAHADMEDYRVGQLQGQLAKLSKAVIPQKYLPASVLPFKVVGIDFWNGKPMVSIVMKDFHGAVHHMLMGQDMHYSYFLQKYSSQKLQSLKMNTYSDWILREINILPNEAIKEAIFVNNRNQRVKVEL